MGEGRIALPVALSATYAAFYLTLGIQMPYLPLWLAQRGLGPEEIAFALSVPLITRLLATPVVGYVSDHLGRPRTMLSLLACGTISCLVILAFSRSPFAIAAVLGCVAVFWYPTFALLDSYASRQARAGHVDYGHARLWGSGAFLVANIVGGMLIGSAGAGAVVAVMLAGQLAYLAATRLLPELPAAPPSLPVDGGHGRPSLSLVAGVAAASLVQASHAALYVFASMHWAALGYSLTLVGILWATGVAAEIVLFRFGTRLLHRLGPYLMIAAGGAAAVIRFAALAYDPPLPLLLALQTLHALTFGATYLGMVELISRGVGEHRAGTGQAAAAWGVNLATSAASLAAGPLWVALGAMSFLVSSALGLAGLVLALVAGGLSAVPRRG